MFDFFEGTNCHVKTYLASLHDQNKTSFFGGPAFIYPIRTI